MTDIKPFIFPDQNRYLNYNQVMKAEFSERIQKISINAGFTCPNRDGSKGRGGCTYCNNQSFSPEYCKPVKTVTQQIEEGINFFRHKYENQFYLAYFQSYTNTYDSLDRLKAIYEEALSHPQVKGIVVGTTVQHDKFGTGKVIILDGSFPNLKATIMFDGAGQKQLLLKFAKLKVVG